MTKEQKRIAKTGILFVIIIFITIWGIGYIRSNDMLSSKTKLFGVYDNVRELSEGNHVYLNGTKIGKVVKVDFLNKNLNKLLVEFHIRNDIKIPDSSVAMIASTDIMGTMGIEIIINKNTNTFCQSGDTLISRVETSIQDEVNEQILPLKLKTESMIGTLDSLLVAFRSVFNPTTRTNIKKSFEHIQITLKNLESVSITLDTLMTSERKRISKIISNTESISSNLENNNENINKILGNIGNMTDSLEASNFISIIENADKAVNRFSEVMDKIEKGEGTLGLLIQDESLYYQLDKSSKDLDELLKDIKENPKRYLRFSAFSLGKRITIQHNDSVKINE